MAKKIDSDVQMDTCERCGKKSKDKYGLLDYCDICSMDLCPQCMHQGCCGRIPALSGMKASADEGEV